MMDEKRYIQSLYTSLQSPVSYSSPQKIYKYIRQKKIKIGLTKIRKALNELDSYTVYKNTPKRFPRPRVRVQTQYQQVEIDLMDVRKSSEFNDGVKYLFVAVDVLSKLAFAYPMKTKTSNDVFKATKTLLDKWPLIQTFSSDRGSEFKSSPFQELLAQRGVRHFFAGGSGKATIVESFIRYLRSRITRFKTENNTQSYINALGSIIDSYNNTCHSSTKFKPSEVNHINQFTVYENLYMNSKNDLKEYKFSYKLGDKVRISLDKSIFQRESDKKFTNEIFTVDYRYKKDGIPMYKLKDCTNQRLIGSFYNQELSKVENFEDKEFEVEKFIDEKRINGIPHLLVKFDGYSDQCAIWIKKRDALKLYK